MVSKNKYHIALERKIFSVIAVVMMLISSPSDAKEDQAATLNLTPEKCISLRQGQACFADIELNWNAPEIGNYCLYSSLDEKALHCWSKTKNGYFKGEIVTKENVEFFLKQADETLAQAQLQMAWVYKRKRSSVSWRVF